ncbi:sensor histidine kinase [Ruminococcaceae bacterium OttesenSCG-928-L11]|nr:sensor histidine kinase [Ruminococcaceae bacterium OttesenSCG-928-L11]
MERIQKQPRIRDRTLVRLVLGYLIIVCVPIITFCMIYVDMLGKEIQTGYFNRKQQWINRGAANLTTQLQEIEATYGILQTNRLFTEYLDYEGSDVQRIYQYVKYVKFCFSEVKAASAFITDVWFYTANDYLLRLRSEFVPFPDDRTGWNYKKGQWSYRPGADGASGMFVYRHNLSVPDYSSRSGTLEIEVSEDIVFSNFPVEEDTINSHHGTALLDSAGRILKSSLPESDAFGESDYAYVLARLDKENKYLLTGGRAYCIAYIPGLDVYYVEIEEHRNQYNRGWVVTQIFRLIVPLLILFSLFYYMIIARFLSRIQRLSNHIQARGGELETIGGEGRNDEIGSLYQAYNDMIVQIRELIQSLHREENLRKEAAYSALQAKIQPHFLYGTLETIRMMAVKNKDRETAAITYSFSKLMRYSLGSSAEVTLQQELDHIRDYLAIQVKRLEPRLSVEYDIQVKPATIRCPFFILQPIVENAVMHGVSCTIQESRIQIHARPMGDTMVEISIADNGVGIEPNRLCEIRRALRDGTPLSVGEGSGGNGLALYNVHERLIHYYGGACGVEIQSLPGEGTVVFIRILSNR